MSGHAVELFDSGQCPEHIARGGAAGLLDSRYQQARRVVAQRCKRVGQRIRIARQVGIAKSLDGRVWIVRTQIGVGGEVDILDIRILLPERTGIKAIAA